MNLNSISQSVSEIKALKRQKDGQQSDLIRISFFPLNVNPKNNIDGSNIKMVMLVGSYLFKQRL